MGLMNREIGAIRVRNFYPADIAADIAGRAVRHPAMGHYHKKHTSSVGRVYTPFIDTKRDPELTARYHDNANASIHEVRSMFHPHLSPVDHIRLLLQELWPAGANLLRLHGRSCFVGAFRVFQPVTSEFYPHNDLITQETDAPEVAGTVEQLVANTYLQVADAGGTLQLWLREPTEEERQTIIDVEGLDPAKIEPPALTFDPQPGDLIMFSSAMLHAVTSTEGRHRVAMATFIGCKGPDQPLFCWS
ncbi:2OG-Fe(II) oxygenase [Amycolatopsis sp. H6(2020)]|nr:2OG-Fe(II) oxygenase [Amycolatopsis sp. H6(2020)]